MRCHDALPSHRSDRTLASRPFRSPARIRSLVLGVAVACGLGASAVVADDGATKPSATPSATPSAGSSATGRGVARALDWQLDFRPGALRLYVDPVDGGKFWYFTYKVVNRSGRDRMWAPRFEFFSDAGEIKVSGKEVPSRVTEQIRTLLGNPLLEDQNQILGDILIGEENAKEGLVVWPAGTAEVNEFTIFVTGVSGKVRKVPDPKTGAPRAERWTLRFNYLVPGDAPARGSDPVGQVPADDDVKEGAERRADDVGVWLWR